MIFILSNQNPRTTFVASVGNSGPGPNRVVAPASGYNNISVAALSAATGFNTVAGISSGGPNNYSDPVNGTFLNARQVVDIAAPGNSIASAYYGGRTGGNGPTLPGSPSGPLGGPISTVARSPGPASLPPRWPAASRCSTIRPTLPCRASPTHEIRGSSRLS